MEKKYFFNKEENSEVDVYLQLLLKPDGAFALLLKYDKIDGLPGYYCLTANCEIQLHRDQALVDVLTYPETAIIFLERYKIARFSGEYVKDGLVKYPIFNFYEKKLREIDNVTYDEYIRYYTKVA